MLATNDKILEDSDVDIDMHNLCHTVNLSESFEVVLRIGRTPIEMFLQLRFSPPSGPGFFQQADNDTAEMRGRKKRNRTLGEAESLLDENLSVFDLKTKEEQRKSFIILVQRFGGTTEGRCHHKALKLVFYNENIELVNPVGKAGLRSSSHSRLKDLVTFVG